MVEKWGKTYKKLRWSQYVVDDCMKIGIGWGNEAIEQSAGGRGKARRLDFG
jgi:hypothetical protein